MQSLLAFLRGRAGLAVFLAAFAVALPETGEAGELRHIAGTSVSLVPIDGFSPSTGIAGFISEDGGAITVTELPLQAYDQIYKAAGNPGKELVPLFASQGMKLQQIEKLPVSRDAMIPFFTLEQGSYDKWMGLFKGTTTVWVIVQSPKSVDREAAVKAMMATVTLGPPASREEQINALPFSVEPAPPFRLAQAYSGLSLGLTVGDKDVDPEGKQPWIAISYEPQPMPSRAALDAFAEKHLTDPARFINARIESKKAGHIAGLDATVFAGSYEAEIGKPPRPKRFLMYLAISKKGRTIAMSVTADKDGLNDLVPAAEAIAQSISIKPGN
ncbi:hypothetical protein J2X76_002746 [Neorhizobium sp. 2083]|uniref:hypothetical protein n=1 Tax=Neorhizobium sp. 2083 TaxID=2817762 RepID=UPI0028565F15|nr:hypothetical protein [Neorhizobium sp. 2083]MDR6817570.1 hypothetical protein [Neorhizobium sp. 2083]